MNHCRARIPSFIALFLFVSLVVINSPKGAFYDGALAFHVHLQQHQGGFEVDIKGTVQD